jgi:GTP-sensing pleiotropic transcriptional regulator CodY
MKAFRFSLESALQWRKAQQTQEEEKLNRLVTEEQLIEAELRALEAAQRSAARTQLDASALSGSDFRAISAYLLGLQGQVVQSRMSLSQAGERLRKQQSVCVEAQRRVELIESLKAKRRSSWQREADHQIELLAAESYLSKRIREQD